MKRRCEIIMIAGFCITNLLVPPALQANSLTESLLSIMNQPDKNATSIPNLDKGTADRGLKVNRDDIISQQLKNPIKLNAIQQQEAIVWGLSEEEEIRYLHLMQNKSRVRYGHLPLSPVEVLGINARNDAERKHYAFMAAQLEIERAARELAWAKAYKEAALQIAVGAPRILPFDTKPYDPYLYQPVAWKPHDKLIVFLSTATPFKGTMATIINNMNRENTLTLDIYLIDNNVSRKTIEDWIKAQNIPAALTTENRITVKDDKERYTSFQKNRQQKGTPETKLPLIFLLREGEIRELSSALF